MVVQNQTSEQPVKLRLDDGECQLLDKEEILFKLVS